MWLASPRSMMAVGLPELLTGRGRKRAEAEIIRAPDKGKAARGKDGTTGARTTRVLKLRGKRVGDAERLAISNVACVHVDGDEFAPGRRPAWQMPLRVAEAAEASERSFIDVAAIRLLHEAHRLEQIGGVRDEQVQPGIIRAAPEINAALRSRRRNAVPVQGDRHIGTAQLDVVVIHHALAIGLMLRLTFVEMIARDRHLRQRLGLQREWLRGRRQLTWHVALRHGALDDIEDRLAGDAIDGEQKARLVHHDERRNGCSVPDKIDNQRRRLGVVIPDVVMHELEMPEILAGGRIDRDYRGGEQIVTGAIGADAVVVRGAERHVENATLDIERYVTPDIDAGAVLRTVPAPAVVAEFPRPRHGVERPHQLAGPRIPGARIACGPSTAIRAAGPFARTRTGDDQILVDARRR